MLVAPGPIDVVTAIACLRFFALAKAIAAWAMLCSLCPRHVGITSEDSANASPKPATLPCPKIAQQPAMYGFFSGVR
jgi:hypothetical protein